MPRGRHAAWKGTAASDGGVNPARRVRQGRQFCGPTDTRLTAPDQNCRVRLGSRQPIHPPWLSELLGHCPVPSGCGPGRDHLRPGCPGQRRWPDPGARPAHQRRTRRLGPERRHREAQSQHDLRLRTDALESCEKDDGVVSLTGRLAPQVTGSGRTGPGAHLSVYGASAAGGLLLSHRTWRLQLRYSNGREDHRRVHDQPHRDGALTARPARPRDRNLPVSVQWSQLVRGAPS
jgi:hypothetical protein